MAETDGLLQERSNGIRTPPPKGTQHFIEGFQRDRIPETQFAANYTHVQTFVVAGSNAWRERAFLRQFPDIGTSSRHVAFAMPLLRRQKPSDRAKGPGHSAGEPDKAAD